MPCILSLLLVATTAALLPSAQHPTATRQTASDGSHTRALRIARLSADGGENPLLSTLKSSFGDAAQRGIKEIEKAMSEAAMQDPSVLEPKSTVLAPTAPLPDSFEDSIRLAAQSCDEVLADGSTQLVIEFDTSAGDETYNVLSRSLTMLQPFLPLFADVAAPTTDDAEEAAAAAADAGTAPPPRIQLLFPDEGTAAYVKQNWGDLPPRTTCMSLPRAQLLDGAQALVLVAPSATEVSAVQRLLAQVEEQAPNTVVMLLNPKLVDMQSTGYGLVGRELRNMVEQTFTVAFALKSYPEGALFRAFPDGWSVWREDAAAEGGYELVYSGSRRPSGDDVNEYLYPDDEDGADGSNAPGVMDGLGKFIKGFQAM